MHKAAEASEDVHTIRLTWGEGHDTEVFGQLVPVLDAKVLPREDGHATLVEKLLLIHFEI